VAKVHSIISISRSCHRRVIQAYKEDTTFKLVAPHTGEVVGELNAREVMHKIAENAGAQETQALSSSTALMNWTT